MEYQLHPSRSRRRAIRLAIHPDGSVHVTAPWFMPRTVIEVFVCQKQDWIARMREKLTKYPMVFLRGDKEEYLALRQKAHDFAYERLQEICSAYDIIFSRLSIRNTKTRWGSCSRQKVLAIHYKILFLPLDLAEYLLVHEACHLQEMNHAPRFWRLVEQQIPDYKNQRLRLRRWMRSSESIHLPA